MLLEKFKLHIQENDLFDKNQRVLIAVSGGVDSIVLCHLMKEIGWEFGIAHCNFQLRGKASDGDAFFVKELAEQLEAPFFETAFKTEQLAIEQKKSIQIIARELRYDWLETIRLSNHFDCIATAHHLNDSIETLLYNLTKGCGIRGLHGILPKNGKIIRPLLFASKAEISAFATKNNIHFREDASNATDKYNRNHLRLNVVPLLKKINPSLEQTFQGNINRFREVEKLYEWSIDFWRKKLLLEREDQLIIQTHLFDEIPALKSVLFEILSPLGFNADQIEQMLIAHEGISGKRFFSTQMELLIDRKHWIIQPKQSSEEQLMIKNISSPFMINDNESLDFQTILRNEVIFCNDSHIAFFDKNTLRLPLKLRRWKEGDIFQPLGMKGKHKKVSDYFHNKKLSLFEKKKVWILESDGQIVWIVGWRTDERFKINDATEKVLKVILK